MYKCPAPSLRPLTVAVPTILPPSPMFPFYSALQQSAFPSAQAPQPFSSTRRPRRSPRRCHTTRCTPRPKRWHSHSPKRSHGPCHPMQCGRALPSTAQGSSRPPVTWSCSRWKPCPRCMPSLATAVKRSPRPPPGTCREWHDKPCLSTGLAFTRLAVVFCSRQR
jgi:hypothetical protein